MFFFKKLLNVFFLNDEISFVLCESTHRARRQDRFHHISKIWRYWVIELLMDFPSCSQKVFLKLVLLRLTSSLNSAESENIAFLDRSHHFGHYLYLLNLNLKLAFSTSFKNTSCEQLGKSMRSSITQYLHIFDMWWNLSCLLARRVLSHKTKQNWSHYFGLIYTFENFIWLFTHLNHISSLW